jgi:hypothetical protein
LPDFPDDWIGTVSVPMDADHVFNGFIGANVAFAYDRLELWEMLESNGVVSRASLSADADARLIDELLRLGVALGWLDHDSDSDSVWLTDAGKDMSRMRGYFTWAVGGYAEVFASAGDIAAGRRRYGEQVLRNEAMVALGSSQNDRRLMADTLDRVLADLDFTGVADLGSGTSARVCRVVRDRPGVTGIGIDLSLPATKLAQQTIGEAGLDGRVRAVVGDVREIVRNRRGREVAGEVDLMMSFFLLHDLLADPATREGFLTGLRETFPEVRTFVLADTVLRPAGPERGTLPIFATGFELAHALMGVPLHTKERYEQLFAAAGLKIAQVHPFGTPFSWLYVLEST